MNRKTTILFSVSLLISLLFFASCKVQQIEIGEIEGIKVNEVNKKKVSLEVLIPINNPNNFNFKLTKADLDIKLNNNELGKITTVKNVRIGKNSNETHSFVVDVEFSKIVANSINLLASIMKGGKTKLTLNGKIKVRAFLIGKTIAIDVDKPVKMLNKNDFNLDFLNGN